MVILNQIGYLKKYVLLKLNFYKDYQDIFFNKKLKSHRYSYPSTKIVSTKKKKLNIKLWYRFWQAIKLKNSNALNESTLKYGAKSLF